MPRDYKSTGFHRRHYEIVADAVKNSKDKSELVDRLESAFISDNSRFDRDRFRRAAGY